MSKKLTLADIKAAAETKFGSTDVELDGITVVLRNPIRLDDGNRKSLLAKIDELSDDDEDGDDSAPTDDVNQRLVLCDVLRIAAENEAQGNALIDAIGNDLGLLMVVFEEWMEKTQAGEA